MWHCVEERQFGEKYFGRFRRKILFENLYADRQAVIGRNPLDEITHTNLQVVTYILGSYLVNIQSHSRA